MTAARIASSDLSGRRSGRGRRDDDLRAVAGGDRAQRVERGVVLVVVGQQLVAGLEAERLEHGVDAGRRVRHEGQAVGVGAQEARRPPPAPRRAGRAGRRSGTGQARPRAGRATRAGRPGPARGRRRTSRG